MNVDNPNDFLTKKDLLVVLAKFFQTRDFGIDQYSLQHFTRPFQLTKDCEHLKLNVTTSHRPDRRNLHFFVKKKPKDLSDFRLSTVKDRAFFKETMLYSIIFNDLQKAQKIQKNDNSWSPKCYFVRPGDVLVMDDLFASGFYQFGPRDLLDREHILAALKTLAYFHSACIILEDRINKGFLKPNAAGNKKFTAGSRTVIDTYEPLNFEVDKTELKFQPENLSAFIDGQLHLFERLPGYSRSEITEVKRQLPDILENVRQWIKPSKKYRNVLCHGDTCTSNMFFRRNENNDLDAVFVDYQKVFYSPPAVDLLLLLHRNAPRNLRSKEVILCYYNVFAEELEKNDVRIQEILPMKEFLESCEEFNALASFINVLYSQIYILPGDIIKKYLSEPELYSKNILGDRKEMLNEAYTKDEDYNSRMTELMNDFIKKCVRF